MNIIKMTSLDLSGKRVLIREDLNVPIKDGEVASDARIRAALPTIQTALDAQRASLGDVSPRPPGGGQVRARNSLWRRWPSALTQLLGVPVALKQEWLNGVVVAPGAVVLLENVRFNKGEKKNSDDLAKKMAALCDIYVMDAFGTAHRAEASTHGVAKYAPGRLRRAAARQRTRRRWRPRSRSRRGRCSRSSAARRCRPSSPCSSRCSPRWIR